MRHDRLPNATASQNSQQPASDQPVVIIGAGPAGLTAAYQLTRHQRRPLVLEKLDKVGGIARTENYQGYLFDMGGHRFFTKSAEINAFWHQLLGEQFLQRPRLSRIYYKQRFFNYPLKPLNTLLGLGPWESLYILASYLRWRLFPYRQEETFEHWVTNRFGKRLFQTFFKSYTEKVWGIPCSELKAEWAAQRIKDLSLRTAVLSMFLKPGQRIKTLINAFEYPRQGPGMLWNMVKSQVEAWGGEVKLNSQVIQIKQAAGRVTSIVVENENGREEIQGDHYLSSMPVTQLIQWLDPPPPPEIIRAAKQLRHRDFLTVGLIVNQPDLFPDNWIYIHDPDVHVGRIQNFKNWSPDMVPNGGKTSLGLEYFCNEGDAIWTMADAALVEMAKREIEQIGLARYEDIEDGVVFRVEKSYPVYDTDYQPALELIKSYLATLENLQTIGRNGLHRYNNQDHAMLTGIYAVRNLLHGESHDLWRINAEERYHEQIEVLDQTAAGEADDLARLYRSTERSLVRNFLDLIDLRPHQ